MSIWQAIILAIVEGLTEFLPVSSTGHMILVSSLLGIKNDEFTKIFEVCIQFGAILSVVVLYWKRFFQSIGLYLKLLAAFVPTAILGKLLNDKIDLLLESVTVVATMLFIGGIVLIFVDKWFARLNAPLNAHSDRLKGKTMEELTLMNCFLIGLFQAISMVPGVSRSAATIIGGQVMGANRKDAAEFSFLLAVPTMFAATAYKLYKGKDLLMSAQQAMLPQLIVGNIVAFIVAILAIRFFIGVLTKYGFKAFGYYRIAIGMIILGMLCMGYDLELP